MPNRTSPPKIIVRVIALLSPGYVRVIIGAGIGPLDGGVEGVWPIEWVPESSRTPNSEFYIAGEVDGVPQVVRESEPPSETVTGKSKSWPPQQREFPWISSIVVVALVGFIRHRAS